MGQKQSVIHSEPSAVRVKCEEWSTSKGLTRFHIELHNGDQKWSVWRRYKKVLELQQTLMKNYGVPNSKIIKKVRFGKVVQSIRCRKIQTLIEVLLGTPKLTFAKEFLEFLGISMYSFCKGFGGKRIEGWLMKRNSFAHKFTHVWRKRWCILKDNYMTFHLDPYSPPVDIIIFDRTTYLLDARPHKTKRKLILYGDNQKVTLKLDHSFNRNLWVKEVAEVLKNFIDQSKFSFMFSFSPKPLLESHVKTFADGQDAYLSIAHALTNAASQIFISDWWLSPDVKILRGEHQVRLDDILCVKANQGVKIHILLYQEIEAALDIGSAKAKKHLTALNNKNIHVIRHPDFALSTVCWSHHDKMVVVDQAIAFIGGLDLCYGRYDIKEHPIFDASPEHAKCWGGEDYYNPRVGVEKDSKGLVVNQWNKTPRMPWHDVHMCIAGTAAAEIARHFAQRWNHHRKDKNSMNLPIIVPTTAENAHRIGEIFHKTVMQTWWNPDWLLSMTQRIPQTLHPSQMASSSQLLAPTESKFRVNRKCRNCCNWLSVDSCEYHRSDLASGNIYDSVWSDLSPVLQRYYIILCYNNFKTLAQIPRPLKPMHSISTIITQPLAAQGPLMNMNINTQLQTPQFQNHRQFTFSPQSQQQHQQQRQTRSNITMPVAPVTPMSGQFPMVMMGNNAPLSPATNMMMYIPSTQQMPVPQLSMVAQQQIPDNSVGVSSLPLISLPDKVSQNEMVTAHQAPPPIKALPDQNETSTIDEVDEEEEPPTIRRPSGEINQQCDSQDPLNTENESQSFEENLAKFTPRPAPEEAPKVERPTFPYMRQASQKQFLYDETLADEFDAQDEFNGRDDDQEEDAKTGSVVEMTDIPTSFDPLPRVSTTNSPFMGVSELEGFLTPGHIEEVEEFKLNFEETEIVKELPSTIKNLTSFMTSKGVEMHGFCYNVVPTKPCGRSAIEKQVLKNTRVLTFNVNAQDDDENPRNDDTEFEQVKPVTKKRLKRTQILNKIFGRVRTHINHQGTVHSKHPSVIENVAFSPTLETKFTPEQESVLDSIRKRLEDKGRKQALWTPKERSFVQILRSVGQWSIGVSSEFSIMEAYIAAIAASRHFIYIENQFFISATRADTSNPTGGAYNPVAWMLLKRLRQAMTNKERFRVVVVVPLHPEGNKEDVSVRVVLEKQLSTIIHHKDSILTRLTEEFPEQDVLDYVCFTSLRTWAVSPSRDKLVSEQIYVHSKLMIVDDSIAIMGSANINDRSMLGNRDSEIAALFGGEDSLSMLGGRLAKTSSVVRSLRINLWAEHLGMDPVGKEVKRIQDPICEDAYRFVFFSNT
eukprot:TRINITY_DN3668_c0_g1_i3.p1 TRINITY_DN3668_c0_g1~~TRINITY_DN3668_c0_g1_i3.p1  ORF type:complete len:1319 (+),score=379.04 TRINITY_DN3668_c0_g1_i3:164-4120(+)